MHADRHDADSQHQRDRLASEDSPGQMPEKHQARQTAEEGKEPQRPLRESQEIEDQTLDPQVKNRSDLSVFERFYKAKVVTTDEVGGQEAFVGPEGQVLCIADKPQGST